MSKFNEPDIACDIESLMRQEILRLQEAAGERLESLRRFLGDIAAAESLGDLEECADRLSLELDAWTAKWDEILDGLECRLGAEEELLLKRVLEQRLEDLARNEEVGVVVDLEPAPPSDLVLRLREFLATADRQEVSAEVARQKLVLAKTALQALQSQQGARNVDAALQELDRREIADLTLLLGELELLVSSLKDLPGQVERVRPVAKVIQAKKPVFRKPVKKRAASPAPASKITPLSAEAIARYEDDYHRHVGILQTLKTTMTTDVQRRELVEFEKLLDHRRAELRAWREKGGYVGQVPLFFADTFEGAIPGVSHVRGPKKPKQKSKATAAKGDQPRQRKNRGKRHRSNRRGLPFNVWAADSWGKDPDYAWRDPNIVLGGAMESNRSRH